MSMYVELFVECSMCHHAVATPCVITTCEFNYVIDGCLPSYMYMCVFFVLHNDEQILMEKCV